MRDNESSAHLTSAIEHHDEEGAGLVAAEFLGLTSYVAPSGTHFLQHASEALFLLGRDSVQHLDERVIEEGSVRTQGSSTTDSPSVPLVRYAALTSAPRGGVGSCPALYAARLRGSGCASVLKRSLIIGSPSTVFRR